MALSDSYTISGEMLNRLYNTLMGYANRCTYEAPRIGGVLQGCPRGAKPTPERLTLPARWMIREIDRDVFGRQQESEFWPLTTEETNEFEALKRKMADWLACSPMSERISQRRCREFFKLLGREGRSE